MGCPDDQGGFPGTQKQCRPRTKVLGAWKEIAQHVALCAAAVCCYTVA